MVQHHHRILNHIFYVQVVQSCFGQEREDGFKESIEKFSESYRCLGISITPKVHIVMDHLVEFFELRPESTAGKSLLLLNLFLILSTPSVISIIHPVLGIQIHWIRKILGSWIRIHKNMRIHGSKGQNINQKLQKKIFTL